jgi:hypothetical protein
MEGDLKHLVEQTKEAHVLTEEQMLTEKNVRLVEYIQELNEAFNSGLIESEEIYYSLLESFLSNFLGGKGDQSSEVDKVIPGTPITEKDLEIVNLTPEEFEQADPIKKKQIIFKISAMKHKNRKNKENRDLELRLQKHRAIS